jgi:hypothetical protein
MNRLYTNIPTNKSENIITYTKYDERMIKKRAILTDIIRALPQLLEYCKLDHDSSFLNHFQFTF